MVIATQNPVEQEGTYRLPEAQLDRFLLRTSLGYPSLADEITAVRSVTDGVTAEQLDSAVDADTLRRMMAVATAVHVDDSILAYAVSFAAATRSLTELRLGASTRGALALIRAVRGRWPRRRAARSSPSTTSRRWPRRRCRIACC